jgi:AraC-like DNA-binding protein
VSTRRSERLYLRTKRGPLTWPPPDGATSLFSEADPSSDLRPHVAKIRWGHEWIPPEAPVEERIVPDGSVQLLFVLSDEHDRGDYDLVVGATVEPTVVRLRGRIEHVGVELRPGAVPALLDVPAGELFDRSVALEDLWGERAAVVHDRLRDTADPVRRIQIIQEALAGALVDRRDARAPAPAAVAEAVRRIAVAAGDLRVADLAADLGLSDRRLQQLFHWHVGLSPKAACRLARFRASVDRLVEATPPPSWSELAIDAGFSDQSHLVNEFRALTGLAPRDFQRRAGFGFLQDEEDDDRYLPGNRTGHPPGGSPARGPRQPRGPRRPGRERR